MIEEKVVQARKLNMKLYPLYRMLSMDLLFFYTVKFIFLTELKGFHVSDILVATTCYTIFKVILQVPISIIIDKIGAKKSAIISNILNIAYVGITLIAPNLTVLIINEFISGVAFGFKNVAEPLILKQSIPESNKKSDIFAKLEGRGTSGNYYIDAIATLLSGFLYTINVYLPFIISAVCAVFAILISKNFKEVETRVKEKPINSVKQYMKDLKVSFKFIFQSNRLKALFLFMGIAWAFITVADIYDTSLLTELQLPAMVVTSMVAIFRLVTGIFSKNQIGIHKRLKNKTLSVIGMSVVIGIMIAGLAGSISVNLAISIPFILLGCFMERAGRGAFGIATTYMGNFADSEMTAKIYAAGEMIKEIFRAGLTLLASYVVGIVSTAYSMAILGGLGIVLMIMSIYYMKPRLGLSPEKYKKKDIYYHVLK